MPHAFGAIAAVVFVVALLAPTVHARQTIGDLRKAAERGDTQAQIKLGVAYRDGIGVTQDLVEAHVWLKMAGLFAQGQEAEANNDAVAAVQVKLTPAQVKASEVRSVALIRQYASAGRGWAQTALGALYQIGFSDLVEKDTDAARQWFDRGAKAGDLRAQFQIGFIYLQGDGVAADASKAMEWFTKAANQDHADAQLLLGTGYSLGKGVSNDNVRAIYWWQKAAGQGRVVAMWNLGEVYRLGVKGVPQDFAQALLWHRRAAERGHSLSQHSLGLMYAEGRGVARDLVEAHKWLDIAAFGVEPAEQKMSDESRAAVAKSMTPAQIDEAKERAGEWIGAFLERVRPAGSQPSLPPPPPPPPPSLAPVRVTGDSAPKRIKYVEPEYPAVAISARIQGAVIVDVTIGIDGRVTDAVVISKPAPFFDGPALKAAWQWQFEPPRPGGVAAPVVVSMVVSFTLK